jgi:hypothetical protein
MNQILGAQLFSAQLSSAQVFSAQILSPQILSAQILGTAIIFIGCPILGGWNLHRWRRWTVGLECIQGLIAVGIAKLWFPGYPEWDIMALIALASGRFWMKRPGGIWSTITGYALHHPFSGLLVGLFSLIATTTLRQSRPVTLAVLLLMPLITALQFPRSTILVLLTAGLSGVLFGIEQQRPVAAAKNLLKLYRPDALDDLLNPQTAGRLASQLSHLRQAGLPVPNGWIIYPGDDPAGLSNTITPSIRSRWTVRSSSADSSHSDTAIDLMSQREVWSAIVQCFEQSSLGDGLSIAAIVQPQILCTYQAWTNCDAPTLKADVPSDVAALVLALIDQVNQHLSTATAILWGYDGRQVWLLQVKTA